MSLSQKSSNRDNRATSLTNSSKTNGVTSLSAYSPISTLSLCLSLYRLYSCLSLTLSVSILLSLCPSLSISLSLASFISSYLSHHLDHGDGPPTGSTFSNMQSVSSRSSFNNIDKDGSLLDCEEMARVFIIQVRLNFHNWSILILLVFFHSFSSYFISFSLHLCTESNLPYLFTTHYSTTGN